MGVLVTLWLVRIALLLYLAAIVRLLTAKADAVTRGCWTAGCVFMTLHVVAAMGVFHGWSHEQAWRHTAEQTAATVGVAVGAGVYFNYLFVLLWGADAAWWWVAEPTYRARPRWATLAVHGYLAFLIFNATVVFESGWLRWLGAAATLSLVGVWWHSRSRVVSA